MNKEQIKKLILATDLLKIVLTMVEQKEDYSLIQRNYNELIESYDLPLNKIRYISLSEFEFIEE